MAELANTCNNPYAEQAVTVAQTQRLCLRTFSLADVDGFFALNNDPVVMQYTGDSPFTDKQAVAEFIYNYDQYHRFGLGRYAVYLKDSNRYIGFSGLRYNQKSGQIDIGFRLMREYWGQGYATESALPCIEMAFEKHHAEQLVARAMSTNLASHAVIKKLGFAYHKEFCEGFDNNHQPVLWTQYTLSRQQYQSNKASSIG